MKALPVELQTEYAALLPPQSLMSLCLVSRDMRKVAFPLLYRSLVIHNDSIGPLSLRIVDENVQHASSLHGLRFAGYVRELTIIYTPTRFHRRKITPDDLRLVTRALPFLKNVHHLRWIETIRPEDLETYFGPEYSDFVQTVRDTLGEKLRILEICFRPDNHSHIHSVEARFRIPLFTFPRLKQLHISSYSCKSGVSAQGAFLYKKAYYQSFCENLEALAPYLQVLDFSTTFHGYYHAVGNFFSTIDASIHFLRLRELHIRSPFKDGDCKNGSTPLVTFIKRHATQLEALSVPCPIEDFSNYYPYKPLDLPSLPNLTKLDAPVSWVNLLIERGLVPMLRELKVWLSLPKEYAEYQTQETSKEELEPLLARLRNVLTLHALDLCQSSIEFDADLVDILAAACPSLTWLAISILDPERNWNNVISSLSQFKSLLTLRTPDVPHSVYVDWLHTLGPSEASHSAALDLAKACPTLLHLESYDLIRMSLSHGCPSIQSMWSFRRGSQDVEMDHIFLGRSPIDTPLNPADFA